MLKLIGGLMLILTLSGCLSYDPKLAAERSQPLVSGAGIIGLQLTDQLGRPTVYTGSCTLRFVLPHLNPTFPAFVRSSREGGAVIGTTVAESTGFRIPFDGSGGAVIVFASDDWQWAKRLPPRVELLAYGQAAHGGFVVSRTFGLERKNERFLRAAIKVPRECYGYF